MVQKLPSNLTPSFLVLISASACICMLPGIGGGGGEVPLNTVGLIVVQLHSSYTRVVLHRIIHFIKVKRYFNICNRKKMERHCGIGARVLDADSGDLIHIISALEAQ